MKKEISSFSATYIIIGLLGILFLLYHSGIQIYTVRTQNSLFEEKVQENKRLAYKLEELKKIKQVRSTNEYKDRFQKENFSIYLPGEIVFILPPEGKEKDDFEGLSPEEIAIELQKKQPIIDQWKEVFLH